MVNDTGFYDGFTGGRGRILQFATGASLGSYIALKTIQPQSINHLERVHTCLLLIQRSAQ